MVVADDLRSRLRRRGDDDDGDDSGDDLVGDEK